MSGTDMSLWWPPSVGVTFGLTKLGRKILSWPQFAGSSNRWACMELQVERLLEIDLLHSGSDITLEVDQIPLASFIHSFIHSTAHLFESEKVTEDSSDVSLTCLSNHPRWRWSTSRIQRDLYWFMLVLISLTMIDKLELPLLSFLSLLSGRQAEFSFHDRDLLSSVAQI